MSYTNIFKAIVTYKGIEFTVTYKPDFAMGDWAWVIDWDHKHNDDPITDEFCEKCELWAEDGLDWILKS